MLRDGVNGSLGVGHIEGLHVRDTAQTGDLAVHGEAGGLKHGLPGVIVSTGHVVVGMVASHDHQGTQHHGGVAGVLDGLDHGLAGGLLGLALHGAHEHVLIAQLGHLGSHLAVGDLGHMSRTVAHQHIGDTGILGGSGGLIAALLEGSGHNGLSNGFLVGVDNGGIVANLTQQGLGDLNGVKLVANLVVQPTHLMHGAEYDEMMEMIDTYRDKFESVAVAEPLLGEVGSDATIINQDKEDVAKAVTAAAVKEAGYDSLDAAAADKTAFVFMGHGTSHTAKVSYSQMQTTMQTLGYDNVFIGTVEGEPEETACENVIEAVKAAGYTKVILRPLMVVAGDHANNDMAGSDDDSWLSMFNASDAFESVDCQIAGLGEIEDVQKLYVAHTKAAIDSLNG